MNNKLTYFTKLKSAPIQLAIRHELRVEWILADIRRIVWMIGQRTGDGVKS